MSWNFGWREGLGGAKPRCSRSRAELLRCGHQVTRWIPLLYLACVMAVVALVSWQASGRADAAAASPWLRRGRIGGSLHVRREVDISVPVRNEENGAMEMACIQDVVAQPSELLLVLRLDAGREKLPGKEFSSCVLGSGWRSGVSGVDFYMTQRAVVRCSFPPEEIAWSAGDMSVHVEGSNEVVRFCSPGMSYLEPLSWNVLVYGFWSTDDDIVLFAKGISRRKRDFADFSRIRCVYDGKLEVAVTHASQEVFRCPHPHVELRHEVMNRKVTLKLDARLLPSVVYYEPSTLETEKRDWRQVAHVVSELSNDEDGGIEMKEHLLCSCNLIWNGAKFLKEWVMYHSLMGVEMFFLYDNNSDDEIEDVIEKLVVGGYTIRRVVWPWIKTQEAGFSHCALLAAHECRWMMFTDVDEFFYPKEWLDDGFSSSHGGADDNDGKIGGRGGGMSEWNSSPGVGGEGRTGKTWKPVSYWQTRSDGEGRAPLVSLIQEMGSGAASATGDGYKRSGQISVRCRDFGPSGLLQHPSIGVTVGYTCRLAAEQRHKSIVLLSAIAKSLKNYIHHFELSSDYQTVKVPVKAAVINHYKYQAWDEFKTKFKRRVSAYVADWTETRKLESLDRAPGLGNEAIKPDDWETRFCEVQDLALRNFSITVFSADTGGGTGGGSMSWHNGT